jgi:hypothetical protein
MFPLAMKKLSIALLTLALPCLSWGQLVMFSAQLNGAQEVPVRVTPALGSATATIDLATNFFTLDYSFSGLLGTQTAAHIHRGAPGVSGGIVIGAPSFPLGSPVRFETTISDALEADLLAGLLYLNIHSTIFPAGEIRGQLQPIPEPSTYGLIGAGVLGALALWRRRIARRSRPAASL